MLNKIILMGRLTRDPELRYTQSSVPVASFTLAVDRDFKNKVSGEKSTDFIDVVVWRQTAEFVSKYFTKGRMAAVDGRLQIREWIDKEGSKRRTAEVVAENVYFCDSKHDGNNSDSEYSVDPLSDLSEKAETLLGSPAGGGFSDIDADEGLPF